MSGNKENSKQYSAADIQRYLRGEMSSEEMHAIETAALDDPFLADAIEGFEMALKKEDEQTIQLGLGKLNKEFNDRIGKPAKVVPLTRSRWWQISAAAAIVIIVGVAVYNNAVAPNENTKSQIAAKEKKQNDSLALRSPEQERSTKLSAVADSQTNQNKKPTTPPPPPTESTEATARPSDKSKDRPTNESLKEKPDVSVIKKAEIKDDEKTEGVALSAKQKAKAPTDAPISSRQREYDAPARTVPESAAARSSQVADKLNTFSGRVVGPDNKPLSYATLQIIPDKTHIVTDQGGNFNFRSKDSIVDVEVGLIGFEQRNFRLQNNIASNKLVLEPSKYDLQEVVVSGYGNEGKKAESKISGKVQNAIPEIGWIEYEKYLESNKKVPETNPQLKGEVVVSFEVKRPDTLRDFKIEKSLSKDHDTEAIRLIREGPSWKLLSNKKTRITVIVRY